jgi:uncharacterized protein (DUF2461 family)
MAFQNNFREISGDKLKLAPKGFPADFPDIDLLKFKSYIVAKEYPESFVSQENFLKEAKSVFQSMYPFIDFLNKVLS